MPSESHDSRKKRSGIWAMMPAPSPVFASAPDAPRWSRLVRTSMPRSTISCEAVRRCCRRSRRRTRPSRSVGRTGPEPAGVSGGPGASASRSCPTSFMRLPGLDGAVPSGGVGFEKWHPEAEILPSRQRLPHDRALRRRCRIATESSRSRGVWAYPQNPHSGARIIPKDKRALAAGPRSAPARRRLSPSRKALPDPPAAPRVWRAGSGPRHAGTRPAGRPGPAPPIRRCRC